ncbi:MAG TPA: hypothetical protein VIK74_03990 [Parasegetibacter sp.]
MSITTNLSAKLELLRAEFSVVLRKYKASLKKDEIFEIRKKILTQLRKIENEIAELERIQHLQTGQINQPEVTENSRT